MATDLFDATVQVREAIRFTLYAAVVPLSTTQIADQVGDTSREVIKKHLAALERAGVVERAPQTGPRLCVYWQLKTSVSEPEPAVAVPDWFDQITAEPADDTDEQEWQESALCAQTDPEAFFPEKGGSTREVKRVCQGCEVRAECLEYALAHDERFGIWGGLSERERRKLKKRAD